MITGIYSSKATFLVGLTVLDKEACNLVNVLGRPLTTLKDFIAQNKPAFV